MERQQATFAFFLGLALAVLPLADAGAALAQAGALVQLAGTAGCVSDDGSGECAQGKALGGPLGVAVSPDGRHAYAATNQDGVAVFARDRKTGVLAQLLGDAGCVSEFGRGECAEGRGLSFARGVALSPDGSNVYIASTSSDAVASFTRDGGTGVLTQLAGAQGCVSETGDGGECANGLALDGAAGVALSRDGRHAYVASYDSDAVAVFARDPATGALTQLAGAAGCVSNTGHDGACADGIGLDGAAGVALSRDGRNVYVASWFSDAVAVFARDAATGALTQLAGGGGCVGSYGGCVGGRLLSSAASVAVSDDGRNVYRLEDRDRSLAAERCDGLGSDERDRA